VLPSRLRLPGHVAPNFKASSFGFASLLWSARPSLTELFYSRTPFSSRSYIFLSFQGFPESTFRSLSSSD